MALFVQQNDNRSKLQEKLAAELQERARARAAASDRPDHVDDSRFIEGTKRTTSLAWVWVLIFFAALAIGAWLTVSILTR